MGKVRGRLPTLTRATGWNAGAKPLSNPDDSTTIRPRQSSLVQTATPASLVVRLQDHRADLHLTRLLALGGIRLLGLLFPLSLASMRFAICLCLQGWKDHVKFMLTIKRRPPILR